MRYLGLALAVCALIALMMIPAHATTFTWYLQASQRSGCIEQQSDCSAPRSTWVVYPPGTPCIWDADDYNKYLTSGTNIDAQATVTQTTCMLSDGAYHDAGVDFVSKSPNLTVTINLTGLGSSYPYTSMVQQSFTLTAHAYASGSLYRYRAIMRLAFTASGQFPQLLAPVVGSNGGVAQQWVLTTTVTNPTSHGVKNNSGQTGITGASYEPLYFPPGYNSGNLPQLSIGTDQPYVLGAAS